MVAYWFVRLTIFLFKIVPFSLLRILSGVLKFFLQHVLSYRKKVIEDNLKRCFPELDLASIRAIENLNYKNLSDITVEGIKGLSFSENELQKRNPIVNPELINRYLDSNQSVIAVCPHFNNWEWTVLSTGYYFRNKAIGIYKQINNPYIDHYIKTLRALSTMMLFSTRETRLMQDEIPKGRVILLMSDQNPSNINDAIWVNFFNTQTACLHGLEKYARKFNLPVVYLHQKRVAHHFYQVKCSLLCEHPGSLADGELTQLFMTAVEHRIRENPSSWLWSHKRWKHTR